MAILLALLLAGPAAATVSIGFPPNATSCYPFGCTDQVPSDRYQQVYAAGSFEGTMAIGEIRFFQTLAPGGNLNLGTYEVRLSTTEAEVNGLSTTFDDNFGSDGGVLFTTVADLNSVFDGTALSLTGTPFFYDPAAGNLLLDLQILGSQQFGPDAAFDARLLTADGAFSRMHNFDGGFLDTGLSTRFLVPEPAAGSLVLAGLLALSSLARRRR